MYTSDENHSTRRNGQSRSWGKENALRLLGQVSRCAIAQYKIAGDAGPRDFSNPHCG
jgi:hypothetical protein